MARKAKSKTGGAPSRDGASPKREPVTRQEWQALEWPPALPNEIAAYSLELLANLATIEAGRRGRRGMRGDKLKTSKREIELTALIMLNNCTRYKCAPPQELADLLCYLVAKLPPDHDPLFWALQEAQGRPRPTAKMFEAINYELKHPGKTANAVAKAVGVTNKTIDAWRKEPRYRRYFVIVAEGIEAWPWVRK